MAAIHIGALGAETEVVLDPLVVTALVNDSTATPYVYSGSGEILYSPGNVTVRASGGVGPYTVSVEPIGGSSAGNAIPTSSSLGYTNNVYTFLFELSSVGTASTTFRASVIDEGGSGKIGALNFIVQCTRTS